MTSLQADARVLACPRTGLSLRECSWDEAVARAGKGFPLEARQAGTRASIGPTRSVLLRADDRAAFPIVDGIPVLLAPEMLLPSGEEHPDPADARYAEAYEVMAYYGAVAERAIVDARLPAVPSRDEERATFPEPREIWIDSVYDAISQSEAYGYLAPLSGKRVLQIGGMGTHAVKFLLAGAEEAWVVSPVMSELAYALALARSHGVADRLRCVAGVAEEMPFSDGLFDGAYSGSSLHLSVTSISFPEVFRILRPGGRLSCVEPWAAPLYALGTRLLGKREAVNAHPMTKSRAAPMFDTFRDASIVHHGAISRYPLVGLLKLGIGMTQRAVWAITRADDAICSLVPPLRRMGSCAVLRVSRD